jgi:hypothetical protein
MRPRYMTYCEKRRVVRASATGVAAEWFDDECGVPGEPDE